MYQASSRGFRIRSLLRLAIIGIVIALTLSAAGCESLEAYFVTTDYPDEADVQSRPLPAAPETDDASIDDNEILARQVYLVSLLREYFFSDSRTNPNSLPIEEAANQFHQNVQSTYDDVNSAVREFRDNPNDLAANREIVDWFEKLPRLASIDEIYDDSVARLVREYGGIRFYGSDFVAERPPYFASESELSVRFLGSYPRFRDSIQMVESILTTTAEMTGEITARSRQAERDQLLAYVSDVYRVSLSLISATGVVGENALHQAIVFDTVSEGRLYHLDRSFRVLQTLSDGLLIYSDTGIGGNFLLETTEQHVDGYRFSTTDYVFVDGIYQYQSLTGIRTVYRLVYVLYPRTLYFL